MLQCCGNAAARGREPTRARTASAHSRIAASSAASASLRTASAPKRPAVDPSQHPASAKSSACGPARAGTHLQRGRRPLRERRPPVVHQVVAWVLKLRSTALKVDLKGAV